MSHPRMARLALAVLAPTARAIARQDAPESRRAAILAASTALRGLPSVFPFARAFRKPALTLSTIRLRSNSATAPKTVNTILPAGVVVSICSLKLTNAMPSELNVSRGPKQVRDGTGEAIKALAFARVCAQTE